MIGAGDHAELVALGPGVGHHARGVISIVIRREGVRRSRRFRAHAAALEDLDHRLDLLRKYLLLGVAERVDLHPLLAQRLPDVLRFLKAGVARPYRMLYDLTAIDERLRLFYVAITRAKSQLYLVSYNRNYSGKSMTRLKCLDETTSQDGKDISPHLPQSSQRILLYREQRERLF